MVTEKSLTSGAATRARILDTAKKLFLSRGYTVTTVQDIMNECAIAKGTLYHHFPSKLKILEALTHEMVEDFYLKIREVTRATNLSVRDKLLEIFQSGTGTNELMSLSLVIYQTLFSDENLLLRHRFQKETQRRFLPFFVKIIQQGMVEGLIYCRSAESTGRLIAEMAQNLEEAIATLIIHPGGHTEPWKAIEETLATYSNAMERVLGSAPGFLSLETSPSVKSMLKAIQRHFEKKGVAYDRNTEPC